MGKLVVVLLCMVISVTYYLPFHPVSMGPHEIP